MDINLLRTKSKDELIEIAKQVNAPYHHMNKPDTIINNILEKVFEQPEKKPQREQAPEKKPPVFLTEEEVEQAVARIKAQKAAFSTSYDHESKCVVLRYFDGRYRHAETISLSCPLTKIIRKAGEIARGPLILRPKDGDWGKLGGSEKNAYTDTVL